MIFHVLNRAIEGLTLFETPREWALFEQLLERAARAHAVDLYEWVAMPNHWHMACAGRVPGAISQFAQWLTQRHARRLRAIRGSTGRGHVYQSRFLAVPVERGEHFLTLAAYITRNPVRANLVLHADEWRWGSHWARRGHPAGPSVPLADWPMPCPAEWPRIIELPEPADRVQAIRAALAAGLPLGSEPWTTRTAARLGLQGRLRHHRQARRLTAAHAPPATEQSGAPVEVTAATSADTRSAS